MKRNKHKIGLLAMTMVAILMSIWSLVISYRALEVSKWVDAKQDNVLDMILFNKDSK